MSQNDPLEEFEKRTAQLFKDVESAKPLEYSPQVMELARQVVAQKEQEKKNPLTEKQIHEWAKNLVKSMYGEK